MQKKNLTISEKQRLMWKISIWIWTPLSIAITTTIFYGIFLFYDTNFNNKMESLFTIFLVSLIFGFIYYLIKSGSLFIDLIKDYKTGEKTLGSFIISDKIIAKNNYYLETENPRFPKIKTDKKTYAKIPKGQNVDLIVSSSNRVYRYNPLIENFRIDKLI